MVQTTKANLINTEVFAQSVQAKLGNALKLSPLAYTESFQGEQAGSIHVPQYQYVGDSTVILEGQPIPIDLLTSNTVALDLVKVGKAVEITDEAQKSGFGNPIGEAENQLARSIANGVENQMFGALADATLTYANPTAEINGDTVLNASLLFGEDIDEPKTLVVHSRDLGAIRRDGAYQDNKLFDTEIIVSDRVPEGFAYLVKNGGIGYYQSMNLQIETDRDIVSKTTVISADQHFAVHLRDASRVVAITIPAGV